jgi:hypothetical protein
VRFLGLQGRFAVNTSNQSFPICDHAMWFKRVLLGYCAASMAVMLVAAAFNDGKLTLDTA